MGDRRRRSEDARREERRRNYRVKTPGARADCVVLDNQGIYELVDLSPDGARLHGDLAVEGALVVGSRADMLLRSPGRLIPTNGRIVREHIGPRAEGGADLEVGVAFEHPWPGAREAVEDMMVHYMVGSSAAPRPPRRPTRDPRTEPGAMDDRASGGDADDRPEGRP